MLKTYGIWRLLMSNNDYMKTNLNGRLKKIELKQKYCLLPIFEGVINSIQSIEERASTDKNFKITDGKISIVVKYDETQLINRDKVITGFEIYDNGCGFNTANFESFKTFDSDYKESKGCKGVGRLQWLKAFEYAKIDSQFLENGSLNHISFTFSRGGISVSDKTNYPLESAENSFNTLVELTGILDNYNQSIQNQAPDLADRLLNHIIWCFLRKEEHPKIEVITHDASVNLDELYNKINPNDIKHEDFEIKDQSFTIYHVKDRSTANKATLSTTAHGRVVTEKEIKIQQTLGISIPLSDDSGSFSYKAFVASEFLDGIVNSERTSFNFAANSDVVDLFSQSITSTEFNNAVIEQIKKFLTDLIVKEEKIKFNKICEFMADRPYYKFLLNEELFDRKELLNFTLDKDKTKNYINIEANLHRVKTKAEEALISQGKTLMVKTFNTPEEQQEYTEELNKYLAQAENLNSADLIKYVLQRRLIIDLLTKAIGLQENNKSVKESMIHNLIFPMKSTLEKALPSENNLWLLDERLSFSSYLASDLSFNQMEITDSTSKDRPDILSRYDRPLLLSEPNRRGFASFTIVEFKRPLREDVSSTYSNDPFAQVFKYIKELRDNKAKLPNGRTINANDCPIFCYIIADFTDDFKESCSIHNLTITADGTGYFGYNNSKNAYFTVLSYDGLINGAQERNQIFFEKLGVPLR